jgi:hypothetical protein
LQLETVIAQSVSARCERQAEWKSSKILGSSLTRGIICLLVCFYGSLL